VVDCVRQLGRLQALRDTAGLACQGFQMLGQGGAVALAGAEPELVLGERQQRPDQFPR